MKKTILITIIILIIGTGGYFLLKKNYPSPATVSVLSVNSNSAVSPGPGSNSSLNPAQTPDSTPNPGPAQPSPQEPRSIIIIKGFAFNPSDVKIKAGATIIWENQDTAPHKIKSETFNSGDLGNGDRFEFKFNTKGTFDYICGIHPSMHGRIIVE